jgi:hypothetical protein
MADIKIIDGVLIQLGPSRLNFSITQWDYIKIQKDGETDVFLPTNKSPERMTSYLKEGLGQQVRLFYNEVIVLDGKKECAILAIEMESGKRFTLADEIDKAKQDGKKAVMNAYIGFIALLVIGVGCTATVIGAIIGIPILLKCWPLYKVANGMKKSIENFPSEAEFTPFYEKNRRLFTKTVVS